MKEIDIKNLNPNDKLFECNKHYIKVRLNCEEQHKDKGFWGPEALCFNLTASVCDKEGKAIALRGSRHLVMPHQVVIPLVNNPDINNEALMEEVGKLVRKTVAYSQHLEAAQFLEKTWNRKSPDKKKG